MDLNTIEATLFELRDCMCEALKEKMFPTACHDTQIVLLSFHENNVPAKPCG